MNSDQMEPASDLVFEVVAAAEGMIVFVAVDVVVVVDGVVVAVVAVKMVGTCGLHTDSASA